MIILGRLRATAGPDTTIVATAYASPLIGQGCPLAPFAARGNVVLPGGICRGPPGPAPGVWPATGRSPARCCSTRAGPGTGQARCRPPRVAGSWVTRCAPPARACRRPSTTSPNPPTSRAPPSDTAHPVFAPV